MGARSSIALGTWASRGVRDGVGFAGVESAAAVVASVVGPGKTVSTNSCLGDAVSTAVGVWCHAGVVRGGVGVREMEMPDEITGLGDAG